MACPSQAPQHPALHALSTPQLGFFVFKPITVPFRLAKTPKTVKSNHQPSPPCFGSVSPLTLSGFAQRLSEITLTSLLMVIIPSSHVS